MAVGQTRITSIYDILQYMASHERTKKEKGDFWERVTAWYLRNDPQMQQVVGRVWRWNDLENPMHTGQDTGIDIVAERLDVPGTYWAVQCKNYDASHKVSLNDLGTFFAAAEADERYTGLIIATVSEDISNNVDELLDSLYRNRRISSEKITPSDMAESNVDWSLLLQDHQESPEERRRRTYSPRPHQQEAINQIQAKFEQYDRAKAIMACGTGKTLMSLRLAEERFADNGCRDVLFCAPSIALVSQAMREWTNQARVDLRSLVVCSDVKASKISEDDLLDTISDVGFPATTDAPTLLERYRWTRKEFPDAMVVVFTTYQSMQVVQDAQAAGLPRFGLCVCDEAHRTAGTKLAADDDVASYQIVIDGKRILADKRLFMTATPKIYGDNVKTKAGLVAAELYSMDDEEKYGPIAYELTFAEAVEKKLLCDYRVVVLAINEDTVPSGERIIVPRSEGEAELKVGEAAKIIGCWRGLATHGVEAQRRLDEAEGDEADVTTDFLLVEDYTSDDAGSDDRKLLPAAPEEEIEPLHRAVGFCSTIQASKDIDAAFEQVVRSYVESTGEHGPDCTLHHVDGSMNSERRKKELDWLATPEDANSCHILTNARCLAEGVDVPSLDAVIFFSPKRSKVDIVQAVGRVMRTFKDKNTGREKELGYIILPVVIPSDMTPEEALSKSDTFDVVWGVLQALRSHDQRIDAYINSLPMRRARKKSSSGGNSGHGENPTPPDGPGNGAGTQTRIAFGTNDFERYVYAKAVEKCGSKVYWSSWAEDVGRIARTHVSQIEAAIENDEVAKKAMDSFLHSLRSSINPGVTKEAAIEMVAQHMVTLPVFDALFGDYKFAKTNPVSVAITEFLNTLKGHGIGDMSDSDRRSLDELYASVRRRAGFCRTDSNRQALIKDLYNEFFSKAFTRTSEKLGIVYTPLEIVDYMLHETDRSLQREFGRHLCDRDVHILDPFSGTGSYMAELVSDPELMPLDMLPWKYAHELHSNEILLLAYYIMVVNIEYAYHSRVGGDYVPFDGAVLTDTFQMDEDNDELDLGMFVDNSERVLRQQETPIHVIVGNPPYSAGQKNANDNNANEVYPTLDQGIVMSYGSKSGAIRQSSLFDSYIRAFRWASDRIGDEGIVCFVTNAGWLRSEAGAGVRRCFSEEFNSIYIFDLLGHNQYRRMTRQQMKAQGENVFGQGSTAHIAITMLVKNPAASERGIIHYHCVGEYLSQEAKLSAIASFRNSTPDWEILTQDRHGDWLDKRDDSWYEMAPLGVSKGSRKTSLGIFAIWSLGVATNRDVWVWNFSRVSLAGNTCRLIEATNVVIEESNGSIENLPFDGERYSWTRSLQNRVKNGKKLSYSVENIVIGSYRPFCKRFCYYDTDLIEVMYQNASIFPLVKPNETAPNIVICESAEKGSLSMLVSSRLPDLHFVGSNQCFPLYWYEKDDAREIRLPAEGEKVIRDAWGNRYIRHDAITDEALKIFQDAYPNAYILRSKSQGGPGLAKQDIFWYTYGILHSPEYRARYANNLQKELPRIPLVDDFERFADAGRALGKLHLEYESAEPYPNLVISGVLPGMDPGPVVKLKWGSRKNPETGKMEKDYTKLIYNKNVTISNIPPAAQKYVVNGRSPLDWMIDRYQVRTDKATGIVNDPNEYSDDPRYIIDLICRLVTVSVKTNEIVAGLPSLHEIAKPASWPMAWGKK